MMMCRWALSKVIVRGHLFARRCTKHEAHNRKDSRFEAVGLGLGVHGFRRLDRVNAVICPYATCGPSIPVAGVL